MKTKIIQNIKVIILGLLFVIGAGYVSATWISAPNTPPNSNADAPLNVGYESQVKSGALSINGKDSAGNNVNYALVTNNVPLKASGGLILETRTTDPSNPENGSIWLKIP